MTASDATKSTEANAAAPAAVELPSPPGALSLEMLRNQRWRALYVFVVLQRSNPTANRSSLPMLCGTTPSI